MELIFKPIRFILGNLIMLIDWLTRPKPMKRDASDQQRIDAETATMSIYQYQMCPFCVKTRRQAHRLGLNIELRDAKTDPWKSELLSEGGKQQVPCLRMEKEDGSVEWMYESTDINAFLTSRYS